jgi:hypothetical protein
VYDVKKRGMMIPIKGERDICEELAKASKDKTVATNLAKYNISPTCPVKEVSKTVTDFTVVKPFAGKLWQQVKRNQIKIHKYKLANKHKTRHLSIQQFISSVAKNFGSCNFLTVILHYCKAKLSY